MLSAIWYGILHLTAFLGALGVFFLIVTILLSLLGALDRHGR